MVRAHGVSGAVSLTTLIRDPEEVQVYFLNGVAVYASPEAKLYPHLDNLFGSYFHQDFDLFGNTLKEIVATYREDTSPEEQEQTLKDIERFLKKNGPGTEQLSQALEHTFKPGVIIEGWEGMNVKQWLEAIAQLLK